jgi:hypothetical protein
MDEGGLRALPLRYKPAPGVIKPARKVLSCVWADPLPPWAVVSLRKPGTRSEPPSSPCAAMALMPRYR